LTSIKIKRNDTKGKFIDTLTLDGVPVNLTGSTIKFLMRRRGRSPGSDLTLIRVGAIAGDPTLGNVEYQPTADDVQQEGIYDHEWQVTFPDGKILTVPNFDFNTVEILRDLGQ
jgi:hypothetical protein